MRYLMAILLLAVIGGMSSAAAAQTPEGKVRVLLTRGGHGFEEKPFYAMFEAMPGIAVTKAQLPKDAEMLAPGLEKKFDVIVMYDMVGAIKPEQQKAFAELLKQGIGVVSLHHNLGAHRNWDEWPKIIGGKFLFRDCVIDGRTYGKSLWKEGEEIKVTVADPNHPITRGLKDFQIHDETYKGYYVAPDVKVLLKTDHPRNNTELAWTTQYGKSRVFYFQLGHDNKAWSNPNYPEIVLCGIRWAAGR